MTFFSQNTGLTLHEKKHSWNCENGLELPPTQDASHHQDYSIFSLEPPPKPSFVTGILGGGVDQNRQVPVQSGHSFLSREGYF